MKQGNKSVELLCSLLTLDIKNTKAGYSELLIKNPFLEIVEIIQKNDQHTALLILDYVLGIF